jgi:hypothetical protein
MGRLGPLPDDEVAEFVARCRAEWQAAGLPEHIEDPETLTRIADLVLAARADQTRHAPTSAK